MLFPLHLIPHLIPHLIAAALQVQVDEEGCGAFFGAVCERNHLRLDHDELHLDPDVRPEALGFVAQGSVR